jgi:hypothetical protein
MRPVLVLTAYLAAWSVAQSPAAAQVSARSSYVAGRDGWTADAVGGGLVTLRTTVEPRSGLGPDEQAGTLLFICTASEDRLIFDPNRTNTIRTVDPSGTGMAYISGVQPAGKQPELPRLVGAAKMFASGSFEVNDLPTADRNTARALVDQIAKGTTRFRVQLTSSPVQSGFERDRLLSFEFVITKSDKAMLDRFENGCKLISSRR